MYCQYRKYLFEEDLNAMEIRLVARGFNKVNDMNAELKVREYRVSFISGIQKSREDPIGYGIEWRER
ncbi:MAG: hypothetical protein H6Q43_2234 [Deltaproteobacteria bacterium]|jgi:hypothetical protein|nr:hypothetical protein [Deltaproteobacteria bacterium]